VNAGGDEHATVTVDDESTVIVADVERFEPLCFCAGYENTHTKPCEYHRCCSSSCSCFGIGIILQRCLHFCEFNSAKLVMIFFLLILLNCFNLNHFQLPLSSASTSLHRYLLLFCSFSLLLL